MSKIQEKIVIGALAILLGPVILVISMIDVKKIKRYFLGKKIAVLGERTAGKSTLLSFLLTGTIPLKSKPNAFAKKMDGGELNLNDLHIQLKETLDVVGNSDDYKSWEKCIKDCDYVFYLLRADKILENDPIAQSKVRTDLKFVSDFLKKENAKAPVMLIGTHADLIPKWNSLISLEEEVSFQDDFRKNFFVRECQAYFQSTNKNHVFLGSLKDIEQIQKVVYNIFKTVQED